MKIFKVINNNIVITLDQNNQEIILMGRGLGFKQRPGNNIDENLIEKRFSLSSSDNEESSVSQLLSNISLEDIKKGIQEFKLTKNRMDILEKNHKTIIDGTYNASVDSMKSSIDVLANYKKRKVAILADMLELGDYSQQLHEEVGNYVATKEIDVLICIGKEAKYMYQKAKEKMKNVYYFTSNQEVIEQLDQFLKNDDVVLVKGSHSMNLKEIVEKI